MENHWKDILHIDFFVILKKNPKRTWTPRGTWIFLRWVSFARVCDIHFTWGAIASMSWISFGKIQWMDQKLWIKKCHFWPIWGILGCFFTLFEPLGAQWVIFENPRMLLFTPYHVVTHAKFQKKQWLPVEKSWRGRTHGIGWILRSQFRLKSGDQKLQKNWY